MTDAGRVLVAGIGNVFLGDDGFGVEVARRLADADLPDTVDVADYGIRGVHLAYDLLDGHHQTVILVDAVPRQEPPGTVFVLEADADVLEHAAVADGHGMDPETVLGLVKALGGSLGRVLVVGCQPEHVDEGMGLSASVTAAVDEAVGVVAELAGAELAGAG